MLDWDDLRFFLAVARAGSTLAAGRRERVSQTTAARRVSVLEKRLGLSLFEHLPSGYRLTLAGEALLPRAEAVEASVREFADGARNHSREASATVRITVDEIYGTTLLVPILRDLREAHPDIRIELDLSEEARDLGAGEADIALRATVRPSGSGLVGRRLGPDDWTIYCSVEYAASRGRPSRRSELARHDFIGGGGPGLWMMYRAWLERNGLANRVALQHGSSSGLLAAVRAGSGLVVLPRLVGDCEPGLVMCLPPEAGNERSLWLLTHERLRNEPRIRGVIDFLAGRFSALFRDHPLGQGPALFPAADPPALRPG